MGDKKSITYIYFFIFNLVNISEYFTFDHPHAHYPRSNWPSFCLVLLFANPKLVTHYRLQYVLRALGSRTQTHTRRLTNVVLEINTATAKNIERILSERENVVQHTHKAQSELLQRIRVLRFYIFNQCVFSTLHKNPNLPNMRPQTTLRSFYLFYCLE